MGLKLLQKLNIHPQDEETFQLINKLESIKGDKFKNKNLDFNEAEEEAKRLEKLLEDGGDK